MKWSEAKHPPVERKTTRPRFNVKFNIVKAIFYAEIMHPTVFQVAAD